MVKVVLMLLALVIVTAASAEPSFVPVGDLKEQCARASEEQRVCLIYVSRIGCPYCAKLEADVLRPLLKAEGLKQQIDLYELPWELQSFLDFDGNPVSAEVFIETYGIAGTPTLLFLDHQGQELSARQVGYQSEDFYWHYLERAISDARSKLLDHKQHVPE